MASYTLKNDLSTVPLNCNTGYNNSWINVENNADRQIFAQASYITNFSDLNIGLSSADLTIGSVKIQDPDSGLHADVVPVGAGMGALRVLSQDLESYQDDITIGDKRGNFANVYAALSALQVYVTNPTVTYMPYSYKLCETRTTGNPSFTPKQILITNLANTDVNVKLTLTSGLSCNIPVGKENAANHSVTLNLEVSAVNNYNGCVINYFA